jgi:antitoxin component HigA of HigAB toxin-antitoxin module
VAIFIPRADRALREIMNAIKTSADYAAALARIEALMGATPEAELAILAELVDEYEQTHAPPAAPAMPEPA